MAEQLLLRKGLYEDLTNSTKCPITPGAISITTDEPGIYIDLAADATHTSDYRVRIGDFISFPSLQALKDASNKYPVGSTKVYSENALYYAIAENVLCKYVPDTNGGHFVWINDISDLVTSINGLKTTVEVQGTTISNINQTIGTTTNNHIATKGKTVYKAIEDEYDRATEAEGELQEQINALTGGETDSIASLKKAISDLDTEYKLADTNIKTSINALKGDGYNDETVHGNAVNIASNAARIQAIEDKNIEDNAEENVIEDIDISISGESDPSVTITNKTATIVLPNKLEKYDGFGRLSSIDQSIVGINNTIINDIKGSEWSKDEIGEPSLASNKAAINEINTKLNDIEPGAQVNKIDKIKVALGVPSSAPNGLSINSGDKSVTITVPSTLTDIGAENRVAGIETAVQIINNTTIPNAIKEAKDYTDDEISELDEKLRDAINTALAGADAMTFKGAIGFKADSYTPNLPTTGVKAGDTYVISTEDSVYHIYHPGDMLIALKDQASDTDLYPGTIIQSGNVDDSSDKECWYHVKTGYEGNHEAKISVIPDTVSGDTTTATGNKIALTSHVAPIGSYGDLGTVEFTTSSSNIEITKTAGNAGVINFNLVWATF